MWLPQSWAETCDRFVTWVAPATEAYHRDHRLYPVPVEIQNLARRYMPRLWTYPDSWQPIAFEDYLATSQLIDKATGRTLKTSPTAHDLAALSDDAQCKAYLKSGEVAPILPAPVYVQVFRDHHPTDPQQSWLYIKYNLVFDWSGLALKTSLATKMGHILTRSHPRRWHRLDIHTAATLAFDQAHRLRLLTLAQHNYQQTFIAGIDLPMDQRPMLAAAVSSNELYLDRGDAAPVEYRVVPFFDDIAFLISPAAKPWLWAIDVVYGRNAGATEVPLAPVFLAPQHPLAAYKGLLAPPKRFLGIYTGQDGPPGYDYHAAPAFTPLSRFAAAGYWRAGDLALLAELDPLLQQRHSIDWDAIVALMRQRLGYAMAQAPTAFSPTTPASPP